MGPLQRDCTVAAVILAAYVAFVVWACLDPNADIVKLLTQ